MDGLSPYFLKIFCYNLGIYRQLLLRSYLIGEQLGSLYNKSIKRYNYE